MCNGLIFAKKWSSENLMADGYTEDSIFPENLTVVMDTQEIQILSWFLKFCSLTSYFHPEKIKVNTYVGNEPHSEDTRIKLN